MTVRLLITTGGGPAECRIALTRFLAVLSTEAPLNGCACEAETVFEGDRHGPKSVIVRLDGKGEEAMARGFEGSIKYVFESPVRPAHRRRNWFLGCSRVDLPEPSSDEPEPRAEDMVFESFRAGGPGGQHQNTTDSAVRVRHLPTGITVVSRSERSQHRNKAEAVRGLRQALAALEAGKRGDSRRSIFALNKDLERGNAVRTFR